MPYLLDGTKIITRVRYCTLTAADLDAFFDILREAFPGIVAYEFVPGEMRFLSSPAEGKGACRIALPDPDWKPECSPAEFNPSIIQLRNPPRKSIYAPCLPSPIERFDSAKWIEFVESSGGSKYGMPPPIPDKAWYWRSQGEMQGYYRVGHDDEKEFIRKFFSLLGKFLYTNCYEVIDLKTKQTLSVHTGTVWWCGPDVARRCHTDPDWYWKIFPAPEDSIWIGTRPIPRVTKRGERAVLAGIA